MEADFQRVYGLDLADLRTGRMRPTRAANLAAHLPPGSMVWRHTGGPQAWTDELHMLARVEHTLRVLAWQRTKDGEKGRNAPEPIEPPEPVGQARAREARVTRKAQRFLERQKARE